MRALILTAGLALALPVSAADVYRCVDTSGRVEYRDTPCTGMKGGKLELEPLNVINEIDQSAARAAGNAIGARAAARVAADQAETERRRMQALETQRAAQADAQAAEQVPPYGWWTYPVAPVRPEHRPRPKPREEKPRPQSLPVDEFKRRL